MACNILLANGTALKFSVGSTYVAGVFTTQITGVTELTPFGSGEAESVELNDLDSADAYKQFCAGVADAGELNFKFKYTKAQLAAVLAIFRADKGWQLTLPDGSKLECDGFLQKCDPITEGGSAILVDCKVKLSGAPLFTPAP